RWPSSTLPTAGRRANDPPSPSRRQRPALTSFHPTPPGSSSLLQVSINSEEVQPSSIAHAEPSDVSLPAVSSFGGLRTPALVYVASSSWAGIRKPSQYPTSTKFPLPRGHVLRQRL